ncbi:hypothetical protein tloyanaT_31100 [Thalassotalea loyana]|uniref:SbsA Ig-like domain-containing protein n=1 Tax=Thalassotalea loyana TaxID=280483 RepID=A0ABQ6HGX7_9GAMM|nr:Ig-like domain-containing protein [Thalassotalea loyana]GLX86857.1 hypothetical protein tloyanaT_31100 [Thalassotalea loyana]
MKQLKSIVLLSLAVTTTFASAKPVSLIDIKPVVVASSPMAGTSTVSPSTKEITIQFSKEMMTNKMWSVVKVEHGNFPDITHDVYFKDDRTFVIPVKLKANTVYAFSINSKNKGGFRDVNGKKAQPYLVSFKTGV